MYINKCYVYEITNFNQQTVLGVRLLLVSLDALQFYKTNWRSVGELPRRNKEWSDSKIEKAQNFMLLTTKMVTTIFHFLRFENGDDNYPVTVFWYLWQRLSSSRGLKTVKTIVHFLWFENIEYDYQFQVVRKFSSDYEVREFFICVLQVDNHSQYTIEPEHSFCEVRRLLA